MAVMTINGEDFDLTPDQHRDIAAQITRIQHLGHGRLTFSEDSYSVDIYINTSTLITIRH